MSLRVAAVAVGPSTGDPAGLLAEAEAGVAEAAGQGASLVVLPELFALPYYAGDPPARWRAAAESADGPTSVWARRAARLYGVSLVYGLALETGRERPRNVAMLTGPGGGTHLLATKMRLPPALPADAHGEADHFEPGPAELTVRACEGVRLAALVCYDRRFAESWRLAAQAGADVVAVLVAGEAPDDPPGFFAAELAGHARAHGLCAISAARYGVETCLGRSMRHDGETLAVSRSGEILAAGGAARPALMSVEPMTNKY